MNRILIFLLLIVSSSLYAQQYDLKETYIPYRKGKLWGLADTSGKIVVEPQYDEIQYQHRIYNNWSLNKKSFFIVVKNGKKGVITPNQVIIEPIFSEVMISSPYMIGQDIGEDKLLSVYNMKGEAFFDEKLVSFKRISRSIVDEIELFRVKKTAKIKDENYEGLFDLYAYNDKTEQLDLLLKDIFHVEYNRLNGREITVGIKDKRSKLLSQKKYNLVKENGQIRLITFVPPIAKDDDEGLMSVAEPYEEILHRSQQSKNKKVKAKYLYEIEEVGKVKTLLVNNNLLINTKNKRIRFEIEEFEINEKQSNQSEYLFNRNDTTYEVSNYVIIKQEGRNKRKPTLLGIVTSQSRITPQFSTVKGFYHGAFEQPFFIVSKWNNTTKIMEYGAINQDETWLFSLQSDFEITGDYDFNHQYFSISKNGKQGLATRNFHPIIQPKYDTIVMFKTGIYQVSIDGKYGVRVIHENQKYKGLEMPVIFKDFPAYPSIFQNNVWVWKMKNENGEILGYALPNGILLYEE